MSTLNQLLGALQDVVTVDMGHELFVGMPLHESHPPFIYTPYVRHGDWTLEGDYWGTNELIITSGHAGTHIDALCHIAVGGHFYDGKGAVESLDGIQGFTHLGAETIAPIVGRAVYIDIATAHGLDVLARDHAITATEIQQVLADSNIEMKTGAAVIIRTGFGSLWSSGAMYLAGTGGNPGIDLSAAEYIEQFRPSAVGSDTTVIEYCPPQAPTLPVHSFLLAQRGIHIIENLNLEHMPRVPAIEIVFICSSLKIRGASGGLVRPLALVERQSWV